MNNRKKEQNTERKRKLLNATAVTNRSGEKTPSSNTRYRILNQIVVTHKKLLKNNCHN